MRKKNRETYGSGSVMQVKAHGEIVPNTYRVCINLGKDDAGRRKKVQKVFHGSLTEARKYAKRLAEEYSGVDASKAHDTFSGVVGDWIVSIETSNVASAASIKQYKTRLGYVEEVIGSRKVATLKQIDIEKALTQIKTNHNLGNTSMNKVFQVTRRVLSYAVNVGVAARNPTDNMISPKIDQVINRRSLTDKEIAKLSMILDSDTTHAYSEYASKEMRRVNWGRNVFGRSAVRGISLISSLNAVRLLLASGMRRGECLGLVWGNVDFDTNQIHIRQTLTASVEIRVPKTASGVRSVAIDPKTMEKLQAWKQFQSEALHLISREGVSVSQGDDTPVFCNDLGSWYDPTNFGRWWNAYRVEIGFPTLKIHELRHSQATQLLAHGADIKTVQTRLGHANASLTLNQYAHAVPANDRSAADVMGTLFAASEQTQEVPIKLGKLKTV